MADFTGGPGNDNITGTSDNDVFDLTQGGQDIVSGRDGDDVFLMGSTFNGNDRLDGGAGYDTLVLDGDYANLNISTDNLAHFERITLGVGHDYTISYYAKVSPDTTFTVDATALGASNTLHFGAGNTYASQLGNFVVDGGDGNDYIQTDGKSDLLTGGRGNDELIASAGTLTGGDGNDILIAYGSGANHLSGGAGDDRLQAAGTSNTLLGGDGDDLITTTGTGASTAFGGTGNDQIDAHGSTGTNVLNGGDGDDILIGGTAQNTLYGGTGDDTLTSSTAGDVIAGGPGNDTLILNRAAATVALVLDGSDPQHVVTLTDGTQISGVETFHVIAGSGDDNITTGAGNDTIDGGTGNNTLNGGAGNDQLTSSGSGTETLTGGDGDDVLTAGSGINTLSGGDGDDVISSTGAGAIDGGTGFDTVHLSFSTDSNIFVNGPSQTSGAQGLFVTVLDVEALTVQTGAGNDIISGTDGDDQINAEDGNNILRGGAGNDQLTTWGTGNNHLDGGTGDDTLSSGYGGQNTLIGGNGNDTITSNGGTATIDGGAGDDAIYAVVGPNGFGAIDGGSGNDTLYIDAGNSELGIRDAHGKGTITVDGVASSFSGIETFHITNGWIGNLTLGDGDDVISGMLSGSNVLNGGGGNDVIDQRNTLGYDVMIGGSGDDTIYGGDFVQKIYGGSGDDTISALNASDNGDGQISLIKGGSGDDTIASAGFANIDGGTGNDVVTFAYAVFTGNITFDESNPSTSSVVTDLDGGTVYTLQTVVNVETFNIYGGSGDDAFATRDGNDLLSGGDGNDTLDGRSGNDTLIGGAGADLLNGGPGDDAFVYQMVADSTGATHDTIAQFDARYDHFAMPAPVSAIDPSVASGSLSVSTFDTDLAATIGAAQLGAGHAVLFTPDSGDLKGDVFLIIDANGTAGYQAGADFVIQLLDALNVSALGVANFTSG
ncbi:MAG TPA: calcium-binding protein [Rhizomicrobium sp.]|jgi:Ca2+-binding RTX toxin-like protein